MNSNAAHQISFDDFLEQDDPTLLPPLKWAGGKRWLAPQLQRLYRPFRDRRLVEPFVGGLSVALALKPQEALLVDVNFHLINFYLWLQKGLKIQLEMLNDRECFLRAREEFNKLGRSRSRTSRRAAERFYYLNRTCFNGLCRFNSRGEFNVPFGRYSTINYVREFSDYRRILSRWKFENADFEKIRLRKKDFIYADPPYDVEFTKYSSADFTWEDQERLARWLSKHPGPVVASNQATPRIVKLYKDSGFQVHTIQAPRMISCDGNRQPVEEILALKGI